jgi:hypothetical protein
MPSKTAPTSKKTASTPKPVWGPHALTGRNGRLETRREDGLTLVWERPFPNGYGPANAHLTIQAPDGSTVSIGGTDTEEVIKWLTSEGETVSTGPLIGVNPDEKVVFHFGSEWFRRRYKGPESIKALQAKLDQLVPFPIRQWQAPTPAPPSASLADANAVLLIHATLAEHERKLLAWVEDYAAKIKQGEAHPSNRENAVLAVAEAIRSKAYLP